MPRDRSSGRKSSSSNKSDIEQPQQQQQQQVNESPKSSPKRKVSQIQDDLSSKPQIQAKQQEKVQKTSQQQKKQEVQTQAPNRYTVYRESFNFNWNMKDFDINKAVEEFGRLDRFPELEEDENSQESGQSKQQEQKQQLSDGQIKLHIHTSTKETTGLSKKTLYTISGQDKNGTFQINRSYSQFVLLRQKLLLRWPGCFIPPLPTKKVGNNPYQLVLIRMKFLNNFLKNLCKVPELYNGQQCQVFFKHDTEEYITSSGKLIENQLQKFKAHSNAELLEKYKEVFGNVVEDLTEQEQTIAISEIKMLESELKSWKIDLSRFKDEIRSLIAAKDKYYIAMTRLSTVLLPQFESVILDWINEDNPNQGKLSTSENTSINPTQPKQGYLLNTQQYGTALKDAALSVRNYNQSLWLIYDIFKYELRQTDAILQAIESYEFLVREMQYLNRNINLNKEQIESLEEKKTTLKIFMMSGSVEEKKQRINKESEEFELKLKNVKDLLNFVLNVLINSIDNFHTDRADQYRRLLAKSSCEELVLVKKLMDFHLFELETFRKKDLFSDRKPDEVKKVSQSKQEQIVEE